MRRVNGSDRFMFKKVSTVRVTELLRSYSIKTQECNKTENIIEKLLYFKKSGVLGGLERWLST